jgi:hypothetical protein
MSLFPTVGQTAPFAGASRPLCDRKEVSLTDQTGVSARFYAFTKSHIAGHFVGGMTNDMASEFDPFSPQFGEKFGVPNLPIRMRDFMGDEVTRIYGDQWGAYNGLYFSSWEVNPPNPTGYAPQMSVACMNDPGPIADPSGATNADGTPVMITDPAYNPAYSNFCYETPFMPGFTAYMDTPVVPTQAFADHYNLPDAEYPEGTPVIKRADFVGNVGPWASTTNQQLVLQSFGPRTVQNPQFSGPNSTIAPYNTKTVTRNYDFGAKCTAIGVGCSAISSVTIGGVAVDPATITWTPAQITLTVPKGLPACLLQQRSASQTLCGEVVITAGNGKQSIDGITVTIGGNKPKVVEPSTTVPKAGTPFYFGEFYPNPLQSAIDNATPGDLIIVDAGSYRENLIMWKPVRLQGVGSGVVTINADAHPAGKMDAWRRRISCLFGLTIQGTPLAAGGQYDPAGQYTCPAPMYFRADRLPFEGFIGWDASSNGNLAQVLQEPSLMGAYEGAGVTVVGRGVNQSKVPKSGTDLWGQIGGAGTFADGSVYVNDKDDCKTVSKSAIVGDYGTSNFLCNPSSIDGLSIINSSQGGGGIYLHGWNHNIQIANNRISANAGTLSGAINLGSGETPPAFTLDNTICGALGLGAGVPTPLCPPSTSATMLFPTAQTTQPNAQIPFQFNANVHIHHNQILDNASIGDALFSGSPAGAGGVTISAGSDNYELDHNWIAANLTSSDGGGVAQMGVSFNGSIHNNFVLFNQANNPTLPVDGGGIIIMGAQEDRTLATGPSAGQECGGVTDLDCPPGIGDGTGPGLVIDSNLILGNSAEDGSGGGLRLRQTNGTEVAAFPGDPDKSWYGITVTNNIIVNNVAGWDGGGVSLQDSFKTTFVNNTVASNDTTASAGVLFKTLGAINAASPPPGCLPTPDPTQPQNPNCLTANGPHIPQPAGLVTMQNTPNMMAQFNGDLVCPKGFGYGDANDSLASRTNGRCVLVSLPKLVNDLFWQNRAFHVEIVDALGNPITGTSTPNGTGLHSNQNIVKLLPFLTYKGSTTVGVEVATGQCGTAPTGQELYWDLGVRNDLLPSGLGQALVFGPASVSSGYTTDATATATIATTGAAKGTVTAITITNPGSGYGAAPAVTITGGGGRNATATATIATTGPAAGTVTAIIVTNRGSRYTSAPTVTVAGITGNSSDFGPIALTATNSIVSDSTNLSNLNGTGNFFPSSTVPVVQAQYCNGARIPPEQCSFNQGANDPGMCMGYFTPAGQSETVGVAPVFLFNGITANATVDEGNNWINMTYGPLTLSRPTITGGTTPTELLVGSPGVAAPNGAYTLAAGSDAINHGATTTATNHDFFGQKRPQGAGFDIGAVEATIVVQLPTLASVSPASGSKGTIAGYTLTGTNLTGASAVTVTLATGVTGANGVTCNGIAVVSATTLTANCTITNGAATGNRNFTVTTPAGTSNAVTFAVTVPAPPTLTSVSPASGSKGTTAGYTLTGTNLTGASAVTVTLATGVTGTNGVTCNGIVVVSATTVTANCMITNGAATGNRNITVTTAAGTSNAETLAVAAPAAPVLTTVAPATVSRGNVVATITLTGTNLSNTTVVAVTLGTGVTGTNGTICVPTASSATQVTAFCVMSAQAALGARNVTVTNGGGTSNAVTLKVGN